MHPSRITARSLRSRRSLRLVAIAAAGATVFGLSACSASPSDAPATSGTTTRESLNIAMAAQAGSFDPAQLDLGQSSYIWDGVYDTLLYVDNTGKIQPNAATTWAYTDSGKTLTLTLRKGMKFSDGNPVTPADVVATIQRDIDTPGTTQAQTEFIDSVAAQGDDIVLKLKQPDPQLLINLGSSLGVIGEAKTLNSPQTATDPIGSGPYVLDKAATVAGSTYTLKLRSDYWNAKAYPFKTATFKVIADATARFNALQSGQVDGGFITAPQAATLKSSGFAIRQVNAMGLVVLDLADRDGTVNPALAKLKVRQAINMAFDRKEYVAKLLQGVGLPTEQIFAPSGGGYEKSLDSTWPYDPAKAKKLLAEAGYPNGLSLTLPSTILTSQYEPTVTQSLKAIGISVSWDAIPDQQLSTVLATKKCPVFMWLDGVNVAARELHNHFDKTGYLNPFGTEDPKLTDLMNQVAATSDPTEANKLYEQINEYIVKNALTAPLFFLGQNWASKSGIEFLPTGSPNLYSTRIFGIAGSK